MNYQEKQEVKGVSVLSLIVLLVLSLGSIGAILSTLSLDKQKDAARLRAEGLAHQIMSRHFLVEKNSRLKRSVASMDERRKGWGDFSRSGSVGQDPWGKAYQYVLIDNEQNSSSYVLIWSSGPDQRDQSREQLQNLATRVSQKEGQFGEEFFLNDDVGFTLVF